MEYGLQLCGLRDLAEKDMDAALRTAAELGFKSVEFAGFYGHSAEELREMLDKYGLSVIGAHCNFKELLNDYEGTVKFHKTLGNKNFVICSNNVGGSTYQERMDRFAEVCDPMIERLEKDGITLAFHNHSFSMMPRNDGTVDFEQMLWRTNIKFEVDVYWAFVGIKNNPVALLERIRDRLVLVHIKDGDAAGEGCYIGQGECPIEDSWLKAKEWGIPMIAESEKQWPDGPTECKAAMDCLKSLDAKYQI
ncbi:MAG: sugar phosphate isomerase/epimerase [Clostridia bacterium]|nr:sugar phosphate isomerase/epimerase [Clostridia bacterium]